MTRGDDDIAGLIDEAFALERAGDGRAAVDLLTEANRRGRSSDLEVALVALRRKAAVRHDRAPARPSTPIEPADPDGVVVEADRAGLSVAALREGLARSGCLLVRGLVERDDATRLADGIDEVLAAYDAAAGGLPCDDGWFSPTAMPDRVAGGLSEEANRRFLRERGGVWTVDAPHMLFELFDLVDASGVGALMTDFLGERPVLSANKCTLRRVPADLVVDNGWHQDGAFLGEEVGALNLWLALSDCGRHAPGLDVLPRRVSRVIPSDEASKFDWSLSHAAVAEAAAGTPLVRPEFRAGDALLFDQLFVHQTGTGPDMVRPRHAIEAWFFAPSAYPSGQVPILY